MADNLESYFKKHLSDDTPAKDNWNVPSDDVWDKVLPEIHKKKGLFIPWKYIYIIGALVVIGIAVIFWPTEINDTIGDSELSSTSEGYKHAQQNSNNLVEKDNANTNTASILEMSDESIKSKTELSTDRAIQNTNSPIDPKSSDLEKINENTEIKNVVYPKKETTNADTQHTKTYPDEAIPIGINKSNFKSASKNYGNEKAAYESASLSSSDNEKENTRIEIIPPKSFNSINISYTGNPSPINKKTTLLPLPKNGKKNKSLPINNKGKFGVGVYFLPTFTSTYLSGNNNSGELETSNMYLYSSNWGLELKYFISNRFAIVTGVGQSEVRSWSKSVVDFGYDTSGEHIMETGEKENTSAVPMPTPFGKINTNITYRFPGDQDIPDGEIMNSMLETHQEVRYLSIPLGVEFNIIRFSQFSWYAEAGIRYNHALKDAASFSSRILHHGHDMDVVAEEMTGHPSYTNYYLDFYLGTGINYQISKSFQINGSARYFNSITKVNEQSDVSTHVRGFNLKIGITYIF